MGTTIVLVLPPFACRSSSYSSSEIPVNVCWAASFNLMGNIVSSVIKAFFVIFTMYYLFATQTKSSPVARRLPLRRDQSEMIIARTQQVVSASVYGVVTIAAIQGILGGLMFWILGIPSPVLGRWLMAFVCMIPVAGFFFLVWLPLAIFTLADIVTEHYECLGSTRDQHYRQLFTSEAGGASTRLHELLIFPLCSAVQRLRLARNRTRLVVLAITLGLLKRFQTRGYIRVIADEHSFRDQEGSVEIMVFKPGTIIT